MRRLAARQWSCTDTCGRRSRASHSSRVSTRTPSYNRRLSDGSRISVSVTVLSMRTCVPDSIPCCLASCNSTPLIACHVSASIAPTALCNADFFGTRNGSTRAKRCTEAESSSANSNPR